MILFLTVVVGGYYLIKGGVYLIKAVALLLTAFYYIVFDTRKGFDNITKKTPQYKEFCKEVDNLFSHTPSISQHL
jgi:hypothetical protein